VTGRARTSDRLSRAFGRARADYGMLAALHVLAALGSTDRPLSQLVGQYTRYVASGEINSEVADVPAALDRMERYYTTRFGAATDRLDGLTVTMGKSWFNLHPSNTEPLLRLNVESPDTATMTGVRDDVLGIVRSLAGF
jgi:phosphomannomutase